MTLPINPDYYLNTTLTESQIDVIVISIIVACSISLAASSQLLYWGLKIRSKPFVIICSTQQSFADILYSMFAFMMLFSQIFGGCSFISLGLLIARNLSVSWATHLSVYAYLTTRSSWRSYAGNFSRTSWITGGICVLQALLAFILSGKFSDNECYFFSFHEGSFFAYFFDYFFVIVALIIIAYCNIKVYRFVKKFSVTIDLKSFTLVPTVITVIWMSAFIDDGFNFFLESTDFWRLLVHMTLTRTVGFWNFVLYGQQIKRLYQQQENPKMVMLKMNTRRDSALVELKQNLNT